jgi:hypothetical protein
MINRLGLLAFAATALAACNNTSTEPPDSVSLIATTVTSLRATPVLPNSACPANSPADRITGVLDRINGSNLSADVKAQITESLQQALTALSNRDLTAAATALQSAIETLEASGAPEPVKDAVSTLLNCVLSQLS